MANQLCADGLMVSKYAMKCFIYLDGHETQAGEQEMNEEFWWERFLTDER
jgi:hypothetical protein